MKAAPEMRKVGFLLLDRIAVIPVELLHWAKWAFLIAACLIVLAGLGRDGYSWGRVAGTGVWSVFVFLATWMGSTVPVPSFCRGCPEGRFLPRVSGWDSYSS